MRSIIQRHQGKIGVLTGFAAQGVQYGSALLMLVFVVTRLTKIEAEIWYIFLTIQGLAVLADFGFQPTIARAFAAAFAGAKELRREGLGEVSQAEANHVLIRRVLIASRRLYLLLAIATGVLLLALGTPYVSSLVSGDPAMLRKVQLSWVLFSVGTALNIYLLWISPLLTGAGRLTSNYAYIILNRGGFALLGTIALLAGGDLTALAATSVMAALAARLLIAPMVNRLMRNVAPPSEADVIQDRAARREILELLWPNASRMGAVSLAGFFITRINVLILSAFAGLTVSASYAVTLQLLSAILAIGQLPTIAALPHLVKLRLEQRLSSFWTMFLKRQAFLIVFSCVGIVVLALWGQEALQMIHSKVQLLSPAMILLLGVVLLLEFNHANCGFFISTGNTVPYVVPIIIAGFAVTILATAAAVAGYGVIGVVLAQGIVQMAYNNWKWPVVLLREVGPWTRRRTAGTARS